MRKSRRIKNDGALSSWMDDSGKRKVQDRAGKLAERTVSVDVELDEYELLFEWAELLIAPPASTEDGED